MRHSVLAAFLTHTASRCKMGLYFTSGFLFLSFLAPNLWGYWTDLNQTWTHIYLWLLFEKFGLNSPWHLLPTSWGQKLLFRDWLWTLTEQISATVGKKLVNLQGILYMPPNLVNFVPHTAENGWQVLPTRKFSYWETLPALPHGRYIKDSRQTLACVI